MSSFFLKKAPKVKTKRKIATGSSTSKQTGKGKGNSKAQRQQLLKPPASKKPKKDEEEIDSDDEELDTENIDGTTSGRPADLVFSSDEAEEETPQDKRLRLAKEYLQNVEKEEGERAEEQEVHGHVAQRLRTEYLDSVGKLRRKIAGNIEGYEAEDIVRLKHKRQHLPICCLALSQDGRYLFSGAKTQYVLKWDVNTRKSLGHFDVQTHNEDPNNDKSRRSHIIAICLSTDMKFLALAEGGNNIQIWCPNELKHLKTLKGHRDQVTALVFRKDTHELYSGSRDRSIKIWSADEMAYVETLFGHQFSITGIDALSRERAISSGGSDCSLRIWKISDESQLIYNGHRSSIENVKFLNDENFISAGDDGSLCLWSAMKKKPVCTLTRIHGSQANNEEANWITSIACVVNTDLIATGSCDGFIRLWQAAENTRKLEKILEIPVTGFVNSLAFNADGTKLFAGIGQEHRLGRWWRLKEAKNNILVIKLQHTTVER